MSNPTGNAIAEYERDHFQRLTIRERLGCLTFMLALVLFWIGALYVVWRMIR